jgi:hypothetical protein
VARRCVVCSHAQVAAINARLRAPDRPSLRALETQLGIDKDALRRHIDSHLSSAVRSDPIPEPEPEPEPPPSPPSPPEPRSDADRIIRFGHRAQRRHSESASAREVFLEVYRISGNLTQSANAAGVTRGVVLRWREHDDTFNAAFNQAEVEAVELLEAEARQRATKGTKLTRRVIRGGRLIEEVEEWRPSDAMLIKLLQALRPEKYGDRLSVTQTTIVKTIDSEAWEAV